MAWRPIEIVTFWATTVSCYVKGPWTCGSPHCPWLDTISISLWLIRKCHPSDSAMILLWSLITAFASYTNWEQQTTTNIANTFEFILCQQLQKAPEVCPFPQMVSFFFSHGREGRNTVGNEGICFLHQGNVQQGVLLCTIHNFQLQSKVCLGWHITLCILYSQLYVCIYIYKWLQHRLTCSSST